MTNTNKNSAYCEGSVLAGALGECAGPALVCLDARQQLLLITNEAFHLLRLSPSVPLHSLADLPAPLPATVRNILEVSTGPLPDQIVQFSHPEQEYTLAIRALPWHPNENGTGLVLILNDLSAVQCSNQSLQRLNRLANLGTLSASMAHEIKNAFVPVRTFIELLLEKQPDAELGQIVRREMGRIDSILSRMLGFAGPNRPVFSKMSLQQLVQHSLRLVQSLLDDRGIRCQCAFTPDTDVVEADAAQLQQALVNLLMNAQEAMPVGGVLNVTTTISSLKSDSPHCADQGRVRAVTLSIEDTGQGIPSENLERLFEPFFTTKPHGTGLGLAITQRIIQEHRGTIAVHSTPAQGTQFTITLPSPNAP